MTRTAGASSPPSPSAVTGWNEEYSDLLNNEDGNYEFLADETGLIETVSWYYSTNAMGSTPGSAAGYLQGTSLRRGEFGTPVPQSQIDYIANEGGESTQYEQSSVIVYRNSDGTGGIASTTEYEWDSETGALLSVTASDPVIGTGQNGSGTANAVTVVFDALGRATWSKDAAGFLTYTEYDAATGAVVKVIEDVDVAETGDFVGLPSGWTTPTGGGQHRITTAEVDELGRPTKVTYPSGIVDYTVYDDANDEVRLYAGWNAGAPTGPTIVSRMDESGTYSEVLTMSATPAVDGGGRPTGAEAIGGLKSLSRTFYNDAGQTVAQHDYFNLSGLTYSTSASLGTPGTHYYRTEQRIGKQGLPNRILTPAGTITRTEYDGQGRVTSEWIGTDDTPTTGFWSVTNLDGTDMVKLAEYEYDGGGVGDGNLTAVTLFPGDGSPDRVTEYGYDWRNRPVWIKDGVETTESTDLNRPITYLVYDNLDQNTQALVFDGDDVAMEDDNEDGVPDQPSASLLRAKSVMHFDVLGRNWKTDAYGVDQSDGTVATTPVTAFAWFGPRGEVVKTQAPGGLVEKAVYDGLGQLAFAYTTDGGSDTTYAHALTVAGDIVFSQIEPGYDADGRVIQVTARDRVHGETGTGALGTATTGVLARVIHVASYYDLGGRLVAELDVGTNGGSAWTRPGSVPSRSDTELVTSYAYSADGLPYEVVGPDGVAHRAAFDALGRTTSETAAYGTADAFTTGYAYDSGGRLSTVTMPGSRVTKYAYDTFERVSEVTERYGTALARTTAIAYNRLGETVGTTDALETESEIAYDVLGRVTSMTAAVGLAVERSSSWTYDVLGRTLLAIDPRANTTAFSYDDIIRTATVTDALGYSTVAEYDVDGRMVSLTDAYGESWTTAYDLRGRVTETADPLGNTTKYRYLVDGDTMVVEDARENESSATMDRFGRTASAKDALDNAVSFAYDRTGRVVTMTDARGTDTAYEYDQLGRLIEVTEADGLAEERTTSFSFSAYGELAATINPRGVVTTYGHDSAGRVTSVTLADGEAEELVFETEYDLLDRTIATTRPGDRVTEMEYDELGQLTKLIEGVGTALERTTAYEYDDAGNLVTITDPLDHATNYEYSKRNERTLIVDALDGEIELEYDKVGNLISLIDPVENETTWTYDDAHRLIAETDPLGKTTSYERDENGNVVEIEDRLGRMRLFAFDENNRVIEEVWKSAGGSTLQTQEFTWDENGNLLTATDPDGSYTFTYDALNRVETTAQPFGVSQTFTYDANGNRLTATDSEGGVLTSTYDNLDRLLTRELAGTGVTPMKAAWDYDAIGDLETVTRAGKSGGSWVTAGVTTYTHDDLGRTTNIRLADVGDKTISEYGYTFDDADRITGMSVNGASRTFGYDDTNQITNDNGTSRTYDANGNRTGGSYATDDANRMTTDGTWTYTYDDAGQATGKSKSGTAWTYEYDHRGQLVEASDGTTTVTYQYDAFGNRIGRSEDDGIAVTEERYVVDGWDTAKPGAVGTENFDVVMDLDGDDDVIARRLFGPGFDELVGGQDGGGTVRWYGTDHLGSVRKVFDNSGTVTNTVDYDAFGGFLGGVPVDRYAYTGREWDSATGLTHYRAREKDGHRFLSEDPMGFGAGDANLARYVGNGAINERDPSGNDYIREDGDTLVLRRTYYIGWLFGNSNVDIVVGRIIVINGVEYVTFGGHNVPRAEAEAGALASGGSWKDSKVQLEWFKNHSVNGNQTDAQGIPKGTLTPGSIGTHEGRTYKQGWGLVHGAILDMSATVAQQFIDRYSDAAQIRFVAFLAKKGWNIVRDRAGKILRATPPKGTTDANAALKKAGKEFDDELSASSKNLGKTDCPAPPKAARTKAEILATNRAAGKAAEITVAKQLESEGNTILGSQVTIRTSQGNRVVDHLIRTPDGRIVAVEVKSGGAVRDATQIAKDNAIATEGGVIVGKNAPTGLEGTRVTIPTIERRVP